MRRRAISAPRVEATLSTPDRSFLGAQGNMVAERSFGPGATVRVVYVDRLGPEGHFTHVITVMWK
jgi:hypothetical protein